MSCSEDGKLTLNAGCGVNMWGDIRVDLQRFSDRLYIKKTTANIIADIQNLPFKEQIFREVHCFHVLEHVDNPKKALKELRRVNGGSLLIRVPIWHLYSYCVEIVTLFKTFSLIPRCGILNFKETFKAVQRWKQRYGDHKWYIHFKKADVNKRYSLPIEYEFRSEES